MSEVVQLYKDKEKQIKAYPKTLASEVYMSDGVTSVESSLENKANKDDVAKISSGTPLFASSTSGMIDTTKNYVNTSDGYLYIYSNGVWTKTTVLYQSTGVNNDYITLNHCTKQINSNNYPFDGRSDLICLTSPLTSQTALRNGILDVELSGCDVTHKYGITRISNNASGNIQIDIRDFTSNTIVASGWVGAYTPIGGFETFTLYESNGSKITGKILIDWSLFPKGTNYSQDTFSFGGLDKNTYSNNLKALNYNSFKDEFNNSQAIKEIYCNTNYPTHKYGISKIKRNVNNVWQIDIKDYTDNVDVASFYSTGYIENTSGVDTVTLVGLRSGEGATINIDWKKLNVGQYLTPIYFKPKSTTREKLEEKINILANATHRWGGKRCWMLGDSFTADGVYPTRLASLCQFGSFVQDGIGGTRISVMADRLNSTTIANVDLVTLLGGTNDFAEGYPLGTINDDKTIGSTYGSIKKIIDKVLTLKPTARLVFFTPIRRGVWGSFPDSNTPNSKGKMLIDYVNAIKEVCALYSIPVCDLWNLSGFNDYNISVLTRDNLHPTPEGYEILAQIMYHFLENI